MPTRSYLLILAALLALGALAVCLADEPPEPPAPPPRGTCGCRAPRCPCSVQDCRCGLQKEGDRCVPACECLTIQSEGEGCCK